MTDPLALDREEMRALGHQTVDLLVDLLTDPEAPALRRASPAEMVERISADAPEQPRTFDALVAQLRDDVFPFMSRCDHPGYMAYIPANPTFPAALGDFMAAALNIYVGTWVEGAGPTRIELVVHDWFRRWIGYPETAAGVLVSGGSAANMTALGCAREALLGPMTDTAVAYVSDQAHSSLARAARLLGFRSDQVRVLPTGADRRLSPALLASAIDADVAAGRLPLFVAASAGTTNTGTIDPLAELAEVCRARGVWLHFDAAYGGFAALTERGRRALEGIELADSVTLDPHKWLYQPFDCGSLLVREGHLLDQAFAIAPDYLKDSHVGHEVNFADRGLQLTRGFHALKVWLSISHFGVAAFRAAIDRCLDLALLAEEIVRDTPELELLSPASLGIICFRRRGTDGADEDAIARENAALVRAFEATGDGLLSSTRLHGTYTVRLCVLNHTTHEEHVRHVLDFFARTDVPGTSVPGTRVPGTRVPGTRVPGTRVPGTRVPWTGGTDHGTSVPGAQGSGSVARRAALPDDDWLSAEAFAVEEVAAVPLFAGLDSESLRRIAGWARERRHEPGEAVTQRWETARDFYVVMAGRARVEQDGATLAEFGPGEFFGELAALDWGAGYGYSRTATVVATEPLRLLVLSPGHLARLLAAIPEIDAAVRAAVRARLP